MPEIVRHYVVGLRSGDVVARDGSSPKMSWHLWQDTASGVAGSVCCTGQLHCSTRLPQLRRGEKKTTPRVPRAGKGAVTGGAVGALRFVCDLCPVTLQCEHSVRGKGAFLLAPLCYQVSI